MNGSGVSVLDGVVKGSFFESQASPPPSGEKAAAMGDMGEGCSEPRKVGTKRVRGLRAEESGPRPSVQAHPGELKEVLQGLAFLGHMARQVSLNPKAGITLDLLHPTHP